IHRVDVAPFDPQDLYNQVISSNHTLAGYAQHLATEAPYDLMHVHDWLPGVAGISLKHIFKTPMVATVHATERGRHQGHVNNSISGQIDALEWKICYETWRLIVCSQYMTNELYWFFGAPRNKMAIIANGIDLNQLTHCPAE